VENRMRYWQSPRGREGPWGRRSPISGGAAVLPNRSFLPHHQIRPGFLHPLSSLTRSETPRPATRRPEQAEGDSARRRGHLPTGLLVILFLYLAFSLPGLGAWERGRGGARLSAHEAVDLPTEWWFCSATLPLHIF
jgi:hypothetical protein